MKTAALLACISLMLGCSDGAGAGSGADGGVTGSPADTAGGTGTDAATPGKPTSSVSGAITVVTLGDSLTEGVGDSEWTDDGAQMGFPGRLQARLKARGADATVKNVGRSGWTSTDLVSGVDWGEGAEPSELSIAIPVLEAAVADGQKAAATVWIGSNDLFGLYSWCHAPDNAQCEADALAEYEKNIDTTLTQLTATGAKVLIALLDDQSKRPVVADPKYAEDFPEIDAAARALMSAQVGIFNGVVTKLAAKHGAVTVDFFHTTLFEASATLDDDGNHPNAAGYETITTIWETSLGAALGL